MEYDSYLIERAVLENKPELITEHPMFQLSLLEDVNGCLMCNIRNEDDTDDEGEPIGFADCVGLRCEDCPFWINNGNITKEEAIAWLKLDEPKSIYDYQYNF